MNGDQKGQAGKLVGVLLGAVAPALSGALCAALGGYMVNTVDAKNVDAIKKLEPGYYWYHDWEGWEPVELQHADYGSLLYMVNDDCSHLIPSEVNDGAYLYIQRLTPPNNGVNADPEGRA